MFLSLLIVKGKPFELCLEFTLFPSSELFDSSWMEYFGGQGLYWVLFNLSKVNQWFQNNSLKVFLGFFVM